MADAAPLVRRAVEVEAGATYREIGIRSFAKGIFHKAPTTRLEIGEKRVFAIKPGDLLFNIVFAWEGAVAVASAAEEGTIGSHRFLTCVPDPAIADARFLFWWFSRGEGRERLLRASPGGAGRNRTLGVEKLAAIEVPLPPVEEQRRIVRQIELLNGKIVEAAELRAESIRETRAVLAGARRAAMESIPPNRWTTLSEYVAKIENGKSPATEGRPAADYEWAVLKVGAVSFGQFDAAENKALPASFAPPPHLEVRPGDFLMSRANTPELVGACAVVHETRPRLMLSDKIFRFVFREPGAVDSAFLNHVMKSPQLRKQIIAGATGTSATMKNISKPKVLGLRIPKIELHEQQRLAAKLDDLESRLTLVTNTQLETEAALTAMPAAILDRAFQGEL
jgi:type I restriction enzyme, S subunit